MKLHKFTLTLLLCLLFLSSEAQVMVNGVDINKDETTICQVIIEGNPFGKRMIYAVDYGQSLDLIMNKDNGFTNEEGKRIKYKSITHIVNMLQSNGWELFHVYSTSGKSLRGFGSTHYYQFRKK